MLQYLKSENYRNLAIAGLKFPSGITVLVGRNGQGKTNLLEALFFLSYGKPFRGTKSESISWGADEALISAGVDQNDLKILLSRNNETKVVINGKNKAVVDLFGKFVSVLFHPEEIEMAAGPPHLRRSWIDRLISTVDKHYLYNLVRYQKTVKNRNKLLKQGVGPKDLEVWDQTLAALGPKIWLQRLDVIKSLNAVMEKQANKLTGKPIKIVYSNPGTSWDSTRAEASYLKFLGERAEIDRRLKTTGFGPHRDDFIIVSEEQKDQNIIEKDIAKFGSRGEQRQAIILLKLTEAAYYNKAFRRAPTIMLDDVFSELDDRNKDLLLSNLVGSQIIITATTTAGFKEETKKGASILRVEAGSVTPF